MALGIILAAMIVGGTTATVSLFSGGGWLTALGLYCVGGLGTVLTLAAVMWCVSVLAPSAFRNSPSARDAKTGSATPVRVSTR